MIEIDEKEFGSGSIYSGNCWFLTDENWDVIECSMEQLYAQMMGWA